MEENWRSVASIAPLDRPGRRLSECIARAKAEEQKFAEPPVPDMDFAEDVRAAVSAHDEPLEPKRDAGWPPALWTNRAGDSACVVNKLMDSLVRHAQ